MSEPALPPPPLAEPSDDQLLQAANAVARQNASITPQEPSDDDLSRAADRMGDVRRIEKIGQLDTIFKASTFKNGDQHARVLELSKTTGAPTDLVEANIDGFTRAAEQADWNPERFYNENPILSQVLLERPDAAPVILKTRELNLIQRLGSYLREGFAYFNAGQLEDLAGQPGAPKGLEEKAAQAEQIAASESAKQQTRRTEGETGPVVISPKEDFGFLDRIVGRGWHIGVNPDTAGPTLTVDQAPPIVDVFRQAWNDQIERAMLGGAIIAKKLWSLALGQEPDTYNLEKRVVDLQSERAPTSYGEGPVEGAVYEATRFLPFMGASALGTAIAGPAGTFGANALLLQGSTYLDLRDQPLDNGQRMDDGTAIAASTIYALLQASVQTATFNKLLKTWGPMGELAAKGEAQQFTQALLRDATLRNMTTDFGKRLFTSGNAMAREMALQSFLAESTAYVARGTAAHGGTLSEWNAPDVVGGAENAAQSALSAWTGSLALGVVGGGLRVGPLIGMMGDTLRADASQRASNKVKALLEYAKGSKALTAIPDAIARIIRDESIQTGVPVEKLWMDARALPLLYQADATGGYGSDWEPVARGLGGDKLVADIKSALVSGDKIPIALEDFLGKWATKPLLMQGIGNDLTTQSYYQTARERAETAKERQQQIADVANDLLAAKTPPETEPEAQLVAAVRDTAAKAGLDEQQVEKNVALWRAFVRTQTQRFNEGKPEDQRLSPDDLFREAEVMVRRGNTSELEPAARAEQTPSGSSPPPPAEQIPMGSREAKVVTPQNPHGEPIRYDVVEADRLIPSHTTNSFTPHPDFPLGVQERNYQQQTEEQLKVVSGAAQLNPAFLLTDTPSPLDGPPLVTGGVKRLVLGGNGRTMMIQRAFQNDAKREEYRAALLRKARSFGIDPAEIEQMRAPVLVRTVSSLSADSPKDALIGGVRRFNEGMTQKLSERARALAEAKTMSPQTVQDLGNLFAAGEGSLRDFMRERPNDVVAILRRDGIITPQNQTEWLTGGELGDAAKDRLEGMFLGRVIETEPRLNATAPSLLNKVERIAPSLLRVSGVNPALDVTERVRNALDILNEIRQRGIKFDDLLNQPPLIGPKLDLSPDTVKTARMIDALGPKALQERFKAWAEYAAPEPQGDLFKPVRRDPPDAKAARELLLNDARPGKTLFQVDHIPGLIDPQEAKAIAAPWFSMLQRAAETAKQAKGTPESWLAVLSKTPGVKAEEIRETGVDKWLKEQKGVVSREQIAKFIADHRVELQEKILGETDPRYEKAMLGGIVPLGRRQTLWYVGGKPAGSEAESLAAMVAHAELNTRGMRQISESAALRRAADYFEEQIRSVGPSLEGTKQKVAALRQVIEANPGRARVHEANLPFYEDELVRLERRKVELDQALELTQKWQAEGVPVLEEIKPGRPTHYDQYVTAAIKPESYRELLLTSPAAKEYRSPHFESDNQGIIAHARIGEATDAQGRKVLMVDEIQSDLHQAGRTGGYADTGRIDELRQDYADLNKRVQEWLDQGDNAYDVGRLNGDWRIRRVDTRFGPPFDTREAAIAWARQQTLGGDEFRHSNGTVDDATLERMGAPEEIIRAHRDALDVDRELEELESVGVPDVPWKDTWEELMARRLVRYAAERDFERIALAPGSMHTKRWGSEQIAWEKLKPVKAEDITLEELGTRWIARAPGRSPVEHLKGAGQTEKTIRDWALDRFNEHTLMGAGFQVHASSQRGGEAGGIDLEAAAGARGLLQERSEFVDSEERLAAVLGRIGKEELAPKLWERMQKEEAGVLEPRAEGFRQAYDKRLRGAFEKILKKYGAKMGVEKVAQDKAAAQEPEVKAELERKYQEAIGEYNRATRELAFEGRPEGDRQQLVARIQELGRRADQLGQALDNSAAEAQDAFVADLPQAARDKVLAEGMPLFQQGQQGAIRGWTQRLREGTKRIFKVVLSEHANLSTFVHESGHVFLELMGDLAERPDAPDALRQDWKMTLDWLGAKDRKAIETQHHEKWARSFEQYLKDGKSPSATLVRVFQRFRLWLSSIYSAAKAVPGAELNPEISGVFDRLIATDREIENQTRAAGFDAPLFTSAEQAGMSPADYADYLESRKRALSAAAEVAQVRTLKDRQRETEKWWKDESAKIEADAQKEYDTRPDVRALRLLRHGDPGSEPALAAIAGQINRLSMMRDLKDAEPELRDAVLKKLIGRISNDGEVIPADIARVLGFTSTLEMLRAAIATPRKADWIKERVAQRMTEKHGDIVRERERLTELVGKVLHEKPTLDWLMREYEALRKRSSRDGMPAPFIESLNSAAAVLVGRTPIWELSARRVLALERKSGEDAFRALGKGEFKRALVAKQQQLLNALTHNHVLKAIEERDAFNELLSRVTTDRARGALGKAGQEYLDGIDRLAEAMGVKKAPSPQEEVGRKTFDDVLARMVADGAPAAFDIEVVRQAIADGPDPKIPLTVDTMREVDKAVRQIRKIATGTLYVMKLDQRLSLENLLADINSEAATNNAEKLKEPASKTAKPWWWSKYETAQAINSTLTDPQYMFERLGKTARDFFWGGWLNARNEEAQIQKRVTLEVAKLWDHVPKTDRARQSELIPEDVLPFPDDVRKDAYYRDRNWLLMVALNMGNASNRERLLGGYGWTEKQVKEALQKYLTHGEMEFVQKTWDLLDRELWPALAKHYEQVNGIPPPKIEATPITLTIDGVERTYRGGYFPAKYDPVAGRSAAGVKQQDAAIAQLYGGSAVPASVARSFTKERARRFEDVVNLQWSVVPAHVLDVVHYTAVDGFVRDAYRAMQERSYRDAVQKYLGPEYEAQIDQWLRVVASSRAEEAPRALRGVLAITQPLRSRYTMAVLGGNLAIMAGDLPQPLLAIFTREVRPIYGGASILQAMTVGGWFSQRDNALKKSPEMQYRADHARQRLEQAIAEAGGTLSTYQKARKFVNDAAFWGYHFIERITSTVVWDARFRQEMADHGDEKRAISAADDSVQHLFPSNRLAEQPALLRDKRGIGGLLAFYSYFNKMYNQIGRRMWHPDVLAFQQAEGVRGKLATLPSAAMTAGYAMGALLSMGAMSELLSGRGPEEDESVPDWLVRKTAASVFLLLPFGGEVAGAVEYALAPEDTVKRPSERSSPVVSSFVHMRDALLKATDSNADDADRLLAASEVLAFGAGLPVNQPRRTAKYLLDPQDTSLPGRIGGVVYGERDGQAATPLTLPRRF